MKLSITLFPIVRFECEFGGEDCGEGGSRIKTVRCVGMLTVSGKLKTDSSGEAQQISRLVLRVLQYQGSPYLPAKLLNMEKNTETRKNRTDKIGSNAMSAIRGPLPTTDKVSFLIG